MASNRNHHFVPQFYLRNFGSGRAIGLYNIDRQLHVPSASIKGQCQRQYLYGRVDFAERALSELEGAAATAIAESITTDAPPQPASPEYLHVLVFLVFQWGRTPAAGAVMNPVATRMARALLKIDGGVPEEMRDEIDSVRVEYESPVTNSLRMAASMPHLLFDLKAKVLLNGTKTEFITSDSPVVLFNQWCQGVSGMGTTGFASRGLQVFLPLSPRHVLLLYDSSVYKVGSKRSLTVTAQRDVVGINGLQLTVADDNLYYSGAPDTAGAIDRLPFQWRRKQADAVELFAAAAKMSITWSEATALETICRMARSRSPEALRSPAVLLAMAVRTAWKKPTSSVMRMASSWGTAKANAFDSSLTT